MCFCLSKGLAAPAGSLLVGPADFIARSLSLRKMLGGAFEMPSSILAGNAALILLQRCPMQAASAAVELPTCCEQLVS
jgi:threonine aldolase